MSGGGEPDSMRGEGSAARCQLNPYLRLLLAEIPFALARRSAIRDKKKKGTDIVGRFGYDGKYTFAFSYLKNNCIRQTAGKRG